MSAESSTGALVETSTRRFVERHRATLDRIEATSDPAAASDMLDEMGALGWLTALTDPEDPSSDCDEPRLLATIARGLGSVSPTLAVRLLAHHFCRTCILGAAPHREPHGQLAQSTWLGSEAALGDPRLGPTLRIVPSGSSTTLRGSMRFVVGGDHARRWLGTAQSADGVLQLVLVEPEAAIEITPVRTLGLHGLGGVDASFADNRIGHFHSIATGDSVADRIAHANRFICPAYLELTLSLLEQAQRLAVNHAQTRRQYGTVLDKLPAVASMLACIERAIAVVRIATHAFQTHPDATLAAVAEVKSITLKATDAALQTLGGAGYIVGNGVERHWRDARQLGELFLRDPW